MCPCSPVSFSSNGGGDGGAAPAKYDMMIPAIKIISEAMAAHFVTAWPI